MTLLLPDDIRYSNNSRLTVGNRVIGLGSKNIGTKLMDRSKKRGRLKQRWVVVGSGSGGIDREGLGKLGGGERHYGH